MNDLKNNKSVIIALTAVFALIFAGAAYWIFKQNSEINELTQQFELTKEELTDEYSQLVLQYEGYELKANNDSLIEKFEAEKLKVQRLKEELSTVKATNARKINDLQKELNIVRKVLKSYIAQVDSLNKVNALLADENKKVNQKYQSARNEARQLSQQKDQLSKRVELASQLDATNINVTPLNKRGKKEDKVSKVDQLSISFLLAKNITATTGDKNIFVRIMTPDDNILTANDNNTFKFENKNITYSIRKDVEYSGEEQNITVYWKVSNVLFPGEYRIDIFADGNLIGRRSFTLKK